MTVIRNAELNEKRSMPVRSRNGGARGETFTRFVRAVARHEDAVEELFDEAFEALRRALVHELRRRSLWSLPPSFVGVYGAESWTEASAVEELLTDCYAFIFVERLARLVEHEETKPNVEGMVYRYLRNFLHDLQKHHDRLGARLFEILRGTVREATGAGKLHVCDGDPEISSSTVLASAAGADPQRLLPEADLREIVRRWNDDLLPHLITASGKRRREAVEKLRRRLETVGAAEVRAFRFQHLLKSFRDDVRTRLAGLYERDQEASRWPFPSPYGWVDRDSFAKLVECVSRLVRNHQARKETRRHLRELWSYLWRYAGAQNVDDLPPDNRLGPFLGIPRNRLPDLRATLGRKVHRCQERLAGKVVDIDLRSQEGERDV